ncbi:MAG: ATP-binding protein, partial [Thiomicrorhabdus sp.]|nr:ATP-binding protein [Thiomicrorhabdus sp.]
FQQAAKQLKTSRESNANLSHGLKTPLNLAFQILEQIEVDSSPENLQYVKQQLQQQLDKIHQLIDRQLKKARIASDSPLSHSFDFNSDLAELFITLKQLYKQQAIQLDCHIADLPGLVIEKEDGFELFGNLLDNAFKWAQSKVVFTLSQVNGCTTILIEDDGVGVDEALLKNLQTRGFRADESTPGHGIGLSIVQDLIAAYSGEICFSQSSLGGLKVKLVFKSR